MRGTLRWLRADIAARKGQALLTAVVVAGVVTALVLAIMLLEGAVNPWRVLFARTHGADMSVYLSQGTDTTRLRRLPGIAQVSGPYQTTPATLIQGTRRSPVQLTAMTPRPPVIAAPYVVAGSWLTGNDPDGVVLEASFAATVHVTVGDRITVQSLDGPAVMLRVIGIADTADQGFYPQWTPGLLWVPARALNRVEPAGSEREELADLRLTDPGANTGLVAQQIADAYSSPSESSVVQRFTTAQEVSDSMASDDRLLGELLGLFGIIALIAAPCAIANVTSGRVLMYRQDLAMLKALGFTPGQVIRMLLAEQAVLGAAGAVLGVALARIITAPQFIRPPDGTWAGFAPLPGSQASLIAAGTVVTVAVATAIPAWHAGRISPVAAVRTVPPRGHLSPLARIGLLVRLPAPLVLGLRDSLTRRLPAVLTVFGVAIPAAMIMIALTIWSTINGFSRVPARIGLAAELTVRQGSYTQSPASLIRTVGTAYPGASFETLLPGDNGTFTALCAGTSARPYPFHVIAGRRYAAPDEAVAGQGFLDLMHTQIGAWIHPTVDGVYVPVHIVGEIVYPFQNGDVLAFGLDALTAAGNKQPPQYWSVVTRHGLSPAAARDRLVRASGGQLDVVIEPNPADGLGVVRLVIAASVLILTVIGLANLLTATAIGLRDHRHETGVLAAIGLTPRQVLATLVVNTAMLSLLGVSCGVLAGLVAAPRLINMQAQASGMGSGIATAPSPLMILALVTAALALTTAAALLLARRTPHGGVPAQG